MTQALLIIPIIALVALFVYVVSRVSKTHAEMKHFIGWYKADGMFWFRIFGIGFSFVNKEKHRPLFSERHGHRNVLRIGKWGIEWLPKI